MDLAHQLLRSGQPQLADKMCRKLIEEDKSTFDAFSMLGDLAKNPNDAVSYYRQAIKIDPSDVKVSSRLGRVCMGSCLYDEAVEAYQQCVELSPGDEECRVALGAALAASGHYNSAISMFEALISDGVQDLNLFISAANVFSVVGELESASACLERASALSPSNFEVQFASASFTFRKGDYELAGQKYEELLLQHPGNLHLLRSAERAYTIFEHYDKAIELLERQYSLSPENGDDIVCRKALVFAKQGLIDKAVATLRSIQNEANTALVNSCMGECYALLGLADDAMAHIENAISTGSRAYNLIFTLLYLKLYNPAEDEDALTQLTIEYVGEALPAEKYDKNYEHANSNRNVIRVGFVSADLRRHSVGYFALPIFEELDRDRFEVFVYDNHLGCDAKKDQFISLADHWRYIRSLSDHEVHSLIQDDLIDVLFDLSGFTYGSRLGVFALRAAPVQVSWLGCPSTTGLSTVDYRLTDSLSDPVGQTDSYYTEKLWRMPELFSVYMPPPDTPPVSTPPALEKGFITFGSFNNFDKLNSGVISLWAAILRELPDSRLVLKARVFFNQSVCARLFAMFDDAGVDSSRIKLLGYERISMNHFARYADIDLALDPFPYNGTTTNCEALWMGVPVITLVGSVHRQRVTYSQLSAIGLEELAVHTEQEYVDIAKRLAGDYEYLSKLRSGMRDRLINSPLMDKRWFVGNFEKAVKGMLEEKCPSKPPAL